LHGGRGSRGYGVVSGEISIGGGLEGLTDSTAAAAAISTLRWVEVSQNYLRRGRNGHTRSQNAEEEMEYLFYRFRKAEQKGKKGRKGHEVHFILPSYSQDRNM